MTSDDITAGLKRVILDGLDRTHPHIGPSGSGRIFTGSLDWHSSVHAHWALLSMARITSDTNLQRQMHERLSDESLQAEREYLLDESNLDFEMPYGRAWLCLLLAELSRQRLHLDEGITQMRHEIGAQVVAWLEQNAQSHELMRCGSHQSWLFAFFLLQISQSGGSNQQRLDDLRPRIARARPMIRALEGAPILGYDFLHLPAILMLINGERPGVEEEPRLNMGVVDEYNCHQCGANAVRLWPHARAQDGRFREGLEQMMARPEQWSGDFRLVSHWVPQFVWLGLLLERGELV